MKLWFHDEDAKFGKPDKFATKGGASINPRLEIPKKITSADWRLERCFKGPFDNHKVLEDLQRY